MMRIAGAFRSAGTIVALLDAAQARLLDVNEAFEARLGWSIEEAVGRTPEELGLWHDPEQGAALASRLRCGESITGFAARIRLRNGRQLCLSVDIEPWQFEGRPAWLCMGRERTADGDGPQSYRALFVAAAEGLYRSLPDGGFLDVNPAMARIFGYTSPERMIEDVGVRQSRLYVDPVHARALNARLLREDRFEQVRSQVFRADGESIWISESCRVVRDAADRVLFYEGSVVDVTAKVAAEVGLRESEALYRILVDNCRDGVFLVQRGRVSFANRALADMLGYSPGELVGREYMSLVAPEDRAAQAQRRADRESGSRALQNYEVRLLRSDGSRGLFEVRADAVEYGGDIASTGVMRDVTEERRQQQALEQAERRFRELFEHSPVGLFRTGVDGTILEANPTMARMLGFDNAEELRAAYGSMTRVYADPAQREALLQRVRAEGRLDDQEVAIRDRSGRMLWVNTNVRLLAAEGEDGPTLAGSVQDITSQREAERRLRFHASHDALTGLPNRLTFQQRLAEAIERRRGDEGADYAVLFLDLDGFKLVNDSLGHAAGDRLLVAIAEQIAVAIADRALVARYGGDEFTVLIEQPASPDEATEMATELLALFATAFDIGGQKVFSGSSIGIVLGRPDYRSPDQVLRDADTAMYRAKALGKSGYAVFDDAMHAAARLRFEVENDLRLALDRSEFELHYQPIVELERGAIEGFEALVRWRHPQRGLLLPVDFLPVAEEAGLIAAIDWWVMEQALQQAADWARRLPGGAELRVGINVDERQLAGPRLIETLQRLIRDSGVAPGRVHIELTETVFRSGRQPFGRVLDQLKAIGLRLVVDDFGTGYSSLDLFSGAPFDALKIDRNFVRDMVGNRRHRAIVRTIAAFAGDLGLSLVAEGVEAPEQAALLLEMGCRSAQGHLYSPAVPAAEFEALIAAGQVSKAVGGGA